MGYSKAILSGKRLEYWNYERTPQKPKKNYSQKADRRTYRKNVGRRLDNAKRCRNAFSRLVAANLVGPAVPSLLTLTYYRSVSPQQAFVYLRELFKSLRRATDWDIRYISVVERQKRGALHFHCLVWGIPEYVSCTHKRGTPHAACRNRGRCERTHRNIQRRWLAGTCDLHITDGSPKLASYMSKYLFKELLSQGFDSTRKDAQRVYKAYTCSRNVMRPVSVTAGATAFLLDAISVDNSTVQTKEYETQWLGRAIYKRYDVI